MCQAKTSMVPPVGSNNFGNCSTQSHCWFGKYVPTTLSFATVHLVSVVQRMHSTSHGINHNPMDDSIGFVRTYPTIVIYPAG